MDPSETDVKNGHHLHVGKLSQNRDPFMFHIAVNLLISLNKMTVDTYYFSD